MIGLSFVLPVLLFAEPAAEMARYSKLDSEQRARPADSAITKAWLDEAARLATLAADLLEKRRYAEAGTLLRATERPLRNAPSWNNLRGYVEFKLGNPKPALHYLQRAVQLDPGNEDYLLDIGEFLGTHQAHQEAVAFFQVAAKRMPQSARVTFGLAIAYIMQNRRDEAQRLLEVLVNGNPRFEAAYKVLGECYEHSGEAERMVTLGRALQQINARNAVGWYLEGAGLLLKGRIEAEPLAAAINALRTSVKLNPRDPRAHFVLAKAFQEASTLHDAIAELEKTIQLDPDHERAHYVIARLYQKTGNAVAAQREFARHASIKQRDRTAEYRRLLIAIRQ